MVAEIILGLVRELNSAVFTLLAVLFVIFWLLYKAGGLANSFKNSEGKNEKIDGKIDTMKNDLAKIEATTNLLYQAHLRTVKGQSPLSLTEEGEDAFDEIKIGEKISRHWEEIKRKFEEKNSDDNPYDIQTNALEIAKYCFEEIFSEEEQDEAKTYAFNSGLNLLEIYPIIGITIRNKVFEERKVNLSDINANNPKQSTIL